MKKSKIISTPDGRVRVSEIDMHQLTQEKLTDNPMLEEHKAQIIVLQKSTGKIVDRQELPHKIALKYGQKLVKEFPDLAYQIVQIVE